MALRKRQQLPAPQEITASMRLAVTDVAKFLQHREPSISRAQEKAWEHYDAIGEIHTPLNHAAKEVGKAKLVAARFDGEPVKEQAAIDLVDVLRSRVGGQAGLLRSYYLNRKVPGEGYLIGYEKDGETFFDFVSPDELITGDLRGGQGDQGKLMRRTRPAMHSKGGVDIVEPIPLDSTIIRIWSPHPRFSDLADGPMVAMTDICEELVILTCSLKAKILSRLAMAGILFLPMGLTAAGPPEQPSGDPTGLTDDPDVNTLIRAFMRGATEPGSPAAAMPIIVRGPDDLGEAIRWITMDREIFETDIHQRMELIGRIHNGLEIQAEVQSGMGTANHWGAWTIQDTHVKVEVAPEVESFAWAATTDYYWPALTEEIGEEAAREHYIGFDLTDLISRPNMAEDARQISDRGALSPEALRKYSGATDADAPQGDEYVRWVGVTVRNPKLALFGLPEDEEIDWDAVAKVVGKGGQTGDPGAPGEDPSVGPGVGDPGSPGGGDGDAPKGDTPSGG